MIDDVLWNGHGGRVSTLVNTVANLNISVSANVVFMNVAAGGGGGSHGVWNFLGDVPQKFLF